MILETDGIDYKELNILLHNYLEKNLHKSMAVIFDYIASVLLLNGEDKIRIQELMTLEYIRCSISAIYEFDLWKHPNRAEELMIRINSFIEYRII